MPIAYRNVNVIKAAMRGGAIAPRRLRLAKLEEVRTSVCLLQQGGVALRLPPHYKVTPSFARFTSE
jgi:hypothetical protein